MGERYMKNKKNLVFLVAALIFCAQFIGNYGNYQLAAIPGKIFQAFQLTDTQFSSLMTAPMLPSIFLSIIIGLLVDRFGISKMVGICLAVATGGLVLRAFATDYTTMLIAMILSGAGCMILNSNLAKIVSSLYPMDKVSKVVGIMMAASTASMAVAYATTAAIPGLSVAFWIPAVISIVVLVLWLVFARESVFSENKMAGEDASQVKESLLVCVKSKNIWLAGLTLMLILGGSMIISSFHVSAVVELKGYSESYAGTFNTVLMIGAILGSMFLPVYVTKNPEKTPIMMLVMGIITAVSAVGMVTLPAIGIYICGFLNGAFRSGIIAVMMMLPVMLKEIGPKYAGTAGGFMVTLELIGSVVIPTYVIVPLGGGSYLNYFMLAGAAMLLASIICFILMKSCGVFVKKEA